MPLHLLFQPMRYLAKAFLTEDSPRRMAVAVAIGMVLGMVPKGNLIAVALLVLLCSLRVNLTIGLLSAVAFSWVGAVCDPIAHHVGRFFLTLSALEPIWATLYDLPLMRWTSFNNTLVFGSLFLGVYLIVPVYLTSLLFFEGCHPWLKERMQRFRIATLLGKADLATRVGAD